VEPIVKQRTFPEHLAHLEKMRNLKVGERVVVPGSGRTGVVVAGPQRHNGWKVRWDEPMFGVTEGWVATANLDREEQS
jgi:hypothetical protein